MIFSLHSRRPPDATSLSVRKFDYVMCGIHYGWQRRYRGFVTHAVQIITSAVSSGVQSPENPVRLMMMMSRTLIRLIETLAVTSFVSRNIYR